MLELLSKKGGLGMLIWKLLLRVVTLFFLYLKKNNGIISSLPQEGALSIQPHFFSIENIMYHKNQLIVRSVTGKDEE